MQIKRKRFKEIRYRADFITYIYPMTFHIYGQSYLIKFIRLKTLKMRCCKASSNMDSHETFATIDSHFYFTFNNV